MEISTGINKKTQFNKTMENSVTDDVSKEGKGKDYFKVKQTLDTALDEEEVMMCEVCGEVHEGTCGMEEEMDVEEATGASSSGSYSGPLFGDMQSEKKTSKIKKIKNSNLEYSIKESLRKHLLETDEEEEIQNEEDQEEQEELPKVRRSDKDRLRRRPYSAKAKFRAGLNEEEEMDEETGAGSSGAYSQPAIWAKNNKNWRAVSDKNFPKYGGPGATYVKVKDKCKKFPYCNQGDINSLEFYEADELMESIGRVSKRLGKPKSYIAKVIMEAMDSSNLGKKLKDTADERATKSAKNNKKTRISKEELEEMITRSFYKSPVTDPKAGIVGVAKMDLPIGKIFSMSGNKPKYE